MPKTTADRLAIGGNSPPTWTEQLNERYADQVKKAKAWLARAKKADLSPETIDDCDKLAKLFAEGNDLANDMDGFRETEKKPFFEIGKEIDAFFNGTFRDSLGTDPKKPQGLARRILQAQADRRLQLANEEKARLQAAADAAQKKADDLEAKRVAQESKGQTKQADVTAVQVGALDRQADTLAAAAAAPMAQSSKTSLGGGRSASVDSKSVCTTIVRDKIDLEKLRHCLDHDAIVKAVNAGLKMKLFSELEGAVIIEQAIGRVR